MADKPTFELGLGTVQFGLDYGISNRAGRPPEREVAAIVAAAIDAGVRVIDTAPAYGKAEDVLGRVLPGDGGLRIVTKTEPIEADRITPALADGVADAVRRSLERLGVPAVDSLLVHHGSDLALPGGPLLADALIGLRDEGLADRLGVSVYGREELEAARRELPVEVVQVPVNVLDQRLVADGTLAGLGGDGVAVHARSVFLQGLLLVEEADAPSTAAAAALGRWRTALADAGVGAVEGALGFVRGLDAVSVAIVGVNSAAELERIVAAAAGPVPPLDYGALACADEAVVDPRRWPA